MPNNYYITEHNILYVQGSVNGKFERKSTKMKATKANIAYVRKNANALLEELVGKPNRVESFEEFGLNVLAATARSRNKATQREVVSKFERLIYPYFAKYAIDEIKPMHIEKWQNKLLEDYSSSTVKSCRHILSKILDKAYANDIIRKNPVTHADKFEVRYSKKKPYSIDEAREMMSMADGFLKLYLNLAFTTGMRTGEVLGLKWSDVNFNLSCIILKRSITKGVVSSSNATKNHERIIYLLPQTLDLLLEYKINSNSEWIFTPKNSENPWQDSKAIVNNHFKPLLEKLGIEYKTLYATRHTFFSISAMANIDPLLLQRMGGHKEGSAITEKHYTTREINDTTLAYARETLKPLEDIFGETK